MHEACPPFQAEVPYAAERWSQAVMQVVVDETDPRTVRAWGRIAGASRSTLGTWCRAASVPVKASLDLARLLRATRITRGSLADAHAVMDIVEPRTIERLLKRAGFGSVGRCPLQPKDVLARRRLILEPRALNSLQRRLDQLGVPAFSASGRYGWPHS